MAEQPIQGEVVITPDPLVPGFQIRIRRDNKKGITGIYQSADGGKTIVPLLPAPSSTTDRPGSVPTLQKDLSVQWQTPSAAAANASSSRSLQAAEMRLIGSAFTNAIFGYFRVPQGLRFRCIEVQVETQTVADAGIKIDLLDSTDAVQNRAVTLNAGQRRNFFTLAQPLLMPGGTSWSAKILQCGSGSAPGENVSIRLILEPVTS